MNLRKQKIRARFTRGQIVREGRYSRRVSDVFRMDGKEFVLTYRAQNFSWGQDVSHQLTMAKNLKLVRGAA